MKGAAGGFEPTTLDLSSQSGAFEHRMCRPVVTQKAGE